MKIKSGIILLLLGYHHFIWHPFTLYLAYRKYVGKPSLPMMLCFIVHDLGYITIGRHDMDTELDNHPEFGAKIMRKLYGGYWGDMVLYHSRDYAKLYNTSPSLLCWVDKLSSEFEPLYFAIFRTWMSGELKTRNIKELECLITDWKEKAINEAKLNLKDSVYDGYLNE